MGTLVTIFLAWFGLSIPVSLVAGRFLAANSKGYPAAHPIDMMPHLEETQIEQNAS